MNILNDPPAPPRDQRVYPTRTADRCSDCPPAGYPTEKTRCYGCPLANTYKDATGELVIPTAAPSSNQRVLQGALARLIDGVRSVNIDRREWYTHIAQPLQDAYQALGGPTGLGMTAEEIARLRDESPVETSEPLVDWKASYVEALRQRDALQTDANRYRWLREYTYVEAYYIDGCGGADTKVRAEGGGDALDLAVDMERIKERPRSAVEPTRRHPRECTCTSCHYSQKFPQVKPHHATCGCFECAPENGRADGV